VGLERRLGFHTVRVVGEGGLSDLPDQLVCPATF
jgi:hypothetical protein